MIWTMRIECIRGGYQQAEWVRVVEVDSRMTLFDLHQLIQDLADFDRDHLFEFFAGRNFRNRAIMLGDDDDVEDWSAYQAVMLEQVFPLPPKFRLFYRFDFGDDWNFQIRMTRKKPNPPEPGVQYPRLIESIGPPLQQYGDYDEE